MSLNGIAKGTELESLMKNMMQAEANGTMMYYALAQLAREQGLDDVAEGFTTKRLFTLASTQCSAASTRPTSGISSAPCRRLRKTARHRSRQWPTRSAPLALMKQRTRWKSSLVRKAATVSACRLCSTSISRRHLTRLARKSMSAQSAATSMSATSTTRTIPMSARSAVSRRVLLS